MSKRGLGRIYQRGDVWWIQYSHRGQLCRETSGSKLEGAAVNLLRRRLAELERGEVRGPVYDRTTFEQLAQMLFDDYEVNGRKSLDRVRRSVAHLSREFGSDRAVDITSDRVSAYVRHRLRNAKPATVRLELAALRRMFTLGLRAGKLGGRPYLPTLEVRNTRSGFFEDEQIEAVLTHLPAHLRPLIQFVRWTGWRIGEAKPLTWRQVDFAAGVVRLEPGTTKNDEGRTFPFRAMPQLEDLLRRQRELTTALERQEGRLVPFVFHREGRPIRSFRAAWSRACVRAGVPGRYVHDLRRTAVRRLERAGVSRSVAMKLTGHKTEAIYRRYAIVSEADLSDGVRKLALMSSGGRDATAAATQARDQRLFAGQNRERTNLKHSAALGLGDSREPDAQPVENIGAGEGS